MFKPTESTSSVKFKPTLTYKEKSEQVKALRNLLEQTKYNKDKFIDLTSEEYYNKMCNEFPKTMSGEEDESDQFDD